MRRSFPSERLLKSLNSTLVSRASVVSAPGLGLSAILLASLLGLAGCVGLTGSSPLAPSNPSATGDVSLTPSPLTFGSVVVGNSNSQTMTLSNTGKADVTVTTLAVSGTGFATEGIATPLTLGAGQSANFTASFQPSAAGVVSGILAVKSSANSLSVALSGTGVASAPQISANTSTVSFGNVTVGTSSSQSVVLTNTGNADLKIASVSASGAGFAASGGSNVTLTPNQSVTVNVTFGPGTAGSVSGGLAIASNAANSVNVQLSGTGVAAPAVKHSVALNWTPSASTVIGYFVYRGTVSGGPYAKLFTSVDATASYTDGTVAGGETYYYVVTSVDSSDVESAYSNQVTVTIPAP